MSEGFVAQLERSGINHQLVDHSPITTIAEVAIALRVSPQVLVKVMLFQDSSTQRLIVALLPGDRRVHWRKLAQATQTPRGHLALLSEEEILTATGKRLGSLTPTRYGQNSVVVFDPTLLGQKVYCCAGSNTQSVCLDGTALFRFIQARKADICA